MRLWAQNTNFGRLWTEHEPNLLGGRPAAFKGPVDLILNEEGDSLDDPEIPQALQHLVLEGEYGGEVGIMFIFPEQVLQVDVAGQNIILARW